jgi:hypothetical protein
MVSGALKHLRMRPTTDLAPSTDPASVAARHPFRRWLAVDRRSRRSTQPTSPNSALRWAGEFLVAFLAFFLAALAFLA